MTTTASQTETITHQQLTVVLETLICTIVRGELAQLVVKRPYVLNLQPDSSLREDLVELLDRHRKGGTKLYSHSEVWNE